MSSSSMPPPADRRWRPLAAPHCPRCGSPETKFCYYNNYSLSQPRHFCKTCRRYWTMGGSLRNVPVGGGCRKNRRPTPRPAPTATPSSPATPASFSPTHVHDRQSYEGAAVSSAPEIDLAALYAKFSNQCAPPPAQFEAGFAAAAELEYLNRPNGGEDFLGQVMSQQLQNCCSEFSADPSGAFGDVSLGEPSPLEFIDSFAPSDLDLSVPDLVNDDSIYKLAIESTPVEGMAFHHHDLYRYW